MIDILHHHDHASVLLDDGPAFRTFSMSVHSPGSVRANAT